MCVNENVNEQDPEAVALKYISKIVQCTRRVSTIELHKCTKLAMNNKLAQSFLDLCF